MEVIVATVTIAAIQIARDNNLLAETVSTRSLFRRANLNRYITMDKIKDTARSSRFIRLRDISLNIPRVQTSTGRQTTTMRRELTINITRILLPNCKKKK